MCARVHVWPWLHATPPPPTPPPAWSKGGGLSPSPHPQHLLHGSLLHAPTTTLHPTSVASAAIRVKGEMAPLREVVYARADGFTAGVRGGGRRVCGSSTEASVIGSLRKEPPRHASTRDGEACARRRAHAGPWHGWWVAPSATRPCGIEVLTSVGCTCGHCRGQFVQTLNHKRIFKPTWRLEHARGVKVDDAATARLP